MAERVAADAINGRRLAEHALRQAEMRADELLKKIDIEHESTSPSPKSIRVDLQPKLMTKAPTVKISRSLFIGIICIVILLSTTVIVLAFALKINGSSPACTPCAGVRPRL